MIHRIVFDTSTLISALIYRNGRLAWLRAHWQQGHCIPLVSSETAMEFTRVLAYPKFDLSSLECFELLSLYLPYCETVERWKEHPLQCRDEKDQMFLNLALCGGADVLVSSDKDLLVLAGQTKFAIESPESYRQRVQQ